MPLTLIRCAYDTMKCKLNTLSRQGVWLHLGWGVPIHPIFKSVPTLTLAAQGRCVLGLAAGLFYSPFSPHNMAGQRRYSCPVHNDVFPQQLLLHNFHHYYYIIKMVRRELSLALCSIVAFLSDPKKLSSPRSTLWLRHFTKYS